MTTVDYHGRLEEAVFLALNRDAGPLLDRAAVILSSPIFGAAVALAIALAVIALVRGRRRIALLVALALALVASDFLGSHVLKPLFGRMRPCYALPPGTVRVLVPVADVGSIPSLHASNLFAMAAVAWAVGRRIGLAAIAVAAAVAWSRIHGGVHWPTDVVAGAGWGTLCGFAAVAATTRLVAPRTENPPTETPGGTRGDG